MIPGVPRRGFGAVGTQFGAQIRVREQRAQVGRELAAVAGIADDRVDERFGVLFAGRAAHGDAAGRHHFEAHQAERLLAAVRQHRIGGGVERVERRLFKERAHVHDRRLDRATAAGRTRASRSLVLQPLDHEPAFARAAHDDVAVRLLAAAHDQPRVDRRRRALRPARRSPEANSYRGRSGRLSRRSAGRRTRRAARAVRSGSAPSSSCRSMPFGMTSACTFHCAARTSYTCSRR